MLSSMRKVLDLFFVLYSSALQFRYRLDAEERNTVTRGTPTASRTAGLDTFVQYTGWAEGAAAAERPVQKQMSCLKHAHLDLS